MSTRLSRAVLREPAVDTLTRVDPADTEVEAISLGKRNAWMRKAMSETDLLPNVVETALGLVGGPFLGDTQISAIVQLVEMSQKNIAEAVTNPRTQRAASTSAFTGFKEAYSGVKGGVVLANERLAAKRKEDKEKSGRKKEEKRRQRELKRELKREREEARDRVVGGGAGTREEGNSSSSDSNDDEHDEQDLPSPPRPHIGPTHTLTPNTDADASDPQASVAFAQVGTSSTSATTMFAPWPGIVISSTIVASPMAVVGTAAQDETRLRSRSPPPVPASTRTMQQHDKPTPAPPPPPPPAHHMRSTLSQSARSLNDIGRSEGARNVVDPPPAPPPANTQTDDIVDTTDSKRKNWKAKLLG